VPDVDVSKQEAVLLASRLEEWNLVAKGTSGSVFRKRNETSYAFYRMQVSLCVCAVINGLVNEVGFENSLEGWRLFIDSSK
jgi:hypothetical protein